MTSLQTLPARATPAFRAVLLEEPVVEQREAVEGAQKEEGAMSKPGALGAGLLLAGLILGAVAFAESMKMSREDPREPNPARGGTPVIAAQEPPLATDLR